MIILLLAEARSGSTNLAKWLHKSLPDFDLLNEPFNSTSNNVIDPIKNYIISEKYYYNEPLINKLITMSDVVFCLYRVDVESQIESYTTALSTDNWYGEYDKIIMDDSLVTLKDEFLKNKINFKDYILKNNLKSFTYEDLYYNGKINELKTFLGIESNIDFPYGEKYRKPYKRTVI